MKPQLPDIHPSAWIAPTAAVMGDVTLGAESSVWYGVVIRADMAPVKIGSQTCLQDGTIVHVDENVPCIVGSRVGVGSGSVVAAGAVLPEGMEVPPHSLVMGVPARIVRQVDEKLAERIAETWQHYVKQAQAHHAGRFPMLQPGD